MQPSFLAPVSNEVKSRAASAIAELRAQNQYEGRQLINSDYLRVEPSATLPNGVTVTVRETWKDFLVSYEGNDPFTWFDLGEPEPIAGSRGPYTVDVTYELASQFSKCDSGVASYYCYQWSVVTFTELTERPAWK